MGRCYQIVHPEVEMDHLDSLPADGMLDMICVITCFGFLVGLLFIYLEIDHLYVYW